VVTYQDTFLNVCGVTQHNVIDMTIVRAGRCDPDVSKSFLNMLQGGKGRAWDPIFEDGGVPLSPAPRMR
jgi:hypothetical protein